MFSSLTEQKFKKIVIWAIISLLFFQAFPLLYFGYDQVEDTLDYSQIYQEIRCLVEGESINLIETLAVKIADLALTYPLVEVVKVRVRKPQAPLGGPLDYAAVETVRSKKQ